MKVFSLLLLLSLIVSGCSLLDFDDLGNDHTYNLPAATIEEIEFIYDQFRVGNRYNEFKISYVRVERGEDKEASVYYFSIDSDDNPCYERGDRFMYKPGNSLEGIMNRDGVFPAAKCGF